MVQAAPESVGGGGRGRVSLYDGQEDLGPPLEELHLNPERNRRLGLIQAQGQAPTEPLVRAQGEIPAGAEDEDMARAVDIQPAGPGGTSNPSY